MMHHRVSWKNKLYIWLCAIVLASAAILPAGFTSSADGTDYGTALTKIASAVKSSVAVSATDENGQTSTGPFYGSIGGEWAVLSEARYGMTDTTWYANYEKNVLSSIASEGASIAGNTASAWKLHKTKSTDNSRVILALTAIGKDPANIGGYNLLAPLADLSYIKKQGINGPIWALLALDSGDYDIPTLSTGSTGTQTTRENLISYILEKELSGGGFALTGTTADVDITAMALQALAPYNQTNTRISAELTAKVQAAVSRGVAVLSGLQGTDGTYGASYGSGSSVSNAESTAQVVTALSALGIDSAADDRFVKTGGSAVSGLLTFYLSDSGMCEHTASGGANQMATEQTFYALVAYDRYKNGKNALYDMTDVLDMSACEVTLEYESCIYAGQAVTPTVTVTYTDLAGAKTELIAGTEYTVSYQDNTAPGTAKVCISGMGRFRGQTTKEIEIKEIGMGQLTSVCNVKKGIQVTWKRISDADGYVIYRKKTSGGWKKYKIIKNGATVSYTDAKVKNGIKYTYKVCAKKGTIVGKSKNQKIGYRISRLTAKASRYKSGKVRVTWKKNVKVTGYQIRFSRKASFAGAKTVTVKKKETTNRTLAGLKKKKTYYIQIRSYKTINGKKYYSAWSTTLKVRA